MKELVPGMKIAALAEKVNDDSKAVMEKLLNEDALPTEHIQAIEELVRVKTWIDKAKKFATKGEYEKMENCVKAAKEIAKKSMSFIAFLRLGINELWEDLGKFTKEAGELTKNMKESEEA